MLERTADGMTRTAGPIVDGIPDAARATLGLAHGALRILLVTTGAVLWLIATILPNIQRSGALGEVLGGRAR